MAAYEYELPQPPQTPYTTPDAWFGADLDKTKEKWVYHLTNEDIAAIDAALAHVKERGIETQNVTKDDFPLGEFAKTMDRFLHQVVHGIGFVLIKGLPVHRYSNHDKFLAYWGLGMYLGRGVSQNAKGHLIGHVRDLGLDPNNPVTRKYATNAKQIFHTDSADIVGLLCLQTAKEGGLSSISSSVTIHNVMLKERPDLVQLLSNPWYIDRKNEIPPGKLPYYRMPVFNHFAGLLSTAFARDFIDAAQRFDEVPRRTKLEIEALDLMLEIANRAEVRLDMELQVGDIQFIHNHQIVHARTEFKDWDEPERKRHLLRLWLCPPNGRPLPEVFAERYGTTTIGNRGGIRIEGQTLTIPYEPDTYGSF